MGLFGGAPKTTTQERIREKAERLAELRNQTDNALKTWEGHMKDAIPKNLEIIIRMVLSKGTISWNHEHGVQLNGENPEDFETKRDVIDLLPELEEALEKKLNQLVADLEAQGRLSVVDNGHLSNTSNGELSRVS